MERERERESDSSFVDLQRYLYCGSYQSWQHTDSAKSVDHKMRIKIFSEATLTLSRFAMAYSYRQSNLNAAVLRSNVASA
jgi:hypothetical protein